MVHIHIFVFDPADMLIGQVLQDDLHIVLVFQTVFQDIELQDAHNTHDDLFHTGIILLEDLDRTFLGDLVDPLHELFSLHCIHLAHPRKMFRCKGGDALIGKTFLRCGEGVSDGEDPRIEHADDISAVRFLDHLSLTRHHLLGLREAHFFSSLYMVHVHSCLELTGADPHESDPVPVSLVHICLDLEHKSRKVLLCHRVYRTMIRHARQRRCCHPEEMLQESLHSEVGQRGPEKYRGEFSFVHQ